LAEERHRIRWRHDDETEELFMIRRSCLLLVFTLAAVVLPVHAQGGCEDSPEDPTVVLALVAAGGAIASSMWATRSRKP
jgi:XrtJ-associated TM-motif-TM protein